ncbi:MAG: LmeA family phospholipid-binding protein, partial [Frankia sp.]
MREASVPGLIGEHPGPAHRATVRAPGRRHRVAIGAIVLVLAGLVVGDRLLVRLVDDRLAARLACLGTLSGGVSVRIGGFPFLVDAVTGHIPSARVTAGRAGPGGALTDVTVDLHDLRLPPLTGLPGGGSATHLAVGSATLVYG